MQPASDRAHSRLARLPCSAVRRVMAAASLIVCFATLLGAGPPWEVWRDLHGLARLDASDQGLLRSSRCPSGCRFDRHSAGDWRYLRLDGEEGVVFEESGAGAITRIWMTMGFGTSDPLDPAVQMRVYVDGAAEPVVELPLPAYFDGSTPPFLPPLVGDRLASSGGNYSYVPIPYREGCRVTLAGAHGARIWYQFGFHRLASPEGVSSFDGTEDLGAWAQMLGAQGSDPWLLAPGSGVAAVVHSGEASLNPGVAVPLVDLSGPDTLTALLVDIPEMAWSQVEIALRFDTSERVRMPASWFFAAGRGGLESTRSLLIGVGENGVLYSYFPMPFFHRAEIRLTYLAAGGTPPLQVPWSIRASGVPAAAQSGLFGAQYRVEPASDPGTDLPLLELVGRGKWVGLFAELGEIAPPSRRYLEGDERVFVDHSLHPSIYGTGVEDFFNGGFYFDQGDVQLALHGSPYHLVTGDGEDATAAYRLMLTDAVTFAHRIEAGLEAGPEGNLSVRASTVAYYYQQPTPGLWLWDRLDLGTSASKQRHLYLVDGDSVLQELDALTEAQPPRRLVATGVYRPPGVESFRLQVPSAAQRLRMRRRLDAGIAGQEAEIWISGSLAGRFPFIDVNEFRRWREVDIGLLPSTAAPAGGAIDVTVVALSCPDAAPEDSTFSAFAYELWADVDPGIFGDGFESGDERAWSQPAP